MNDDELDLWLSSRNDQLDARVNARINLELRRQQVRSATAAEPNDDEPDMAETHAIWSTDSRSRRGRVPSVGRRAMTRPASIRPTKRSATDLRPSVSVARYRRKSADATRGLAVTLAVLCLLVFSAVLGDFASQWRAAVPPSERDGSLVIGVVLTEGAGMIEETGRYKFAIDLAEWLADNLHYSPVTIKSFLDSGNNAEMLRRGEVDMILTSNPVTGPPEAEVLSTGPYLMVQGGILVRADNTAIRTIGDLDGKRVCTWDGAKYGRQSMRLGNSVPVERDLLSSCLEALKDGSLDAVAGDRLLLWGIAKAEGLDKLSVVPGLNFGDQQRYGIELDQDSVSTCNDVRDAIHRFITSGAWDRAVQATMPDVPPAMVKPDPGHLDRCE